MIAEKSSKQESLEEAFLSIIKSCDDPNREGLEHTPKRSASVLKYLTSGYKTNLKLLVNDALFEYSGDGDIVLIENIDFFSTCEHHLLPIIGKCHVGYIPNKKILGLSKISRIVEMFAHRLQVQERLTRQIAETINDVTNAIGTGVVIEATHLCMSARGIKKANASAKTISFCGDLKTNKDLSDKFIAILNK